MRFRITALLLGLLLAAAASANDVSIGINHYATIQMAVNAASDGNVILVDDGNYVENVTVNKNITLQSVNGRGSTTITGVPGGSEQGTIYILSGSNGVRIGGTGHGFKIIGFDGPKCCEKAAIYLQNAHTNLTIQGNEIYADGDEGLMTEWDREVSYVTIDDNIFSGQAFNLPTPGGDGFGGQYDFDNVPRQLVVMGGGPGTLRTHHITFTNNLISGIAGGINSDGIEQGNNLVTIDADNSVITGNTFSGTTTRGAASIRCRRPLAAFSGNTFISTGLSQTCRQVTFENNTVTPALIAANTFDKGVYVDGGAQIGVNLQAAINVVPAATTINVLAGEYRESLNIGKSITLLGPNQAISPNGAPRVAEAVLKPQGAGNAILVTADAIDVTVRGFDLDLDAATDAARFVELVNRLDTHWSFEKNIFTRAKGAINGNWYVAGNIGSFSLVLNDNLFVNNSVSNGISLWGTTAQAITITNNVWDNNGGWAMNLNNVHGVIANNVFRDAIDSGPNWSDDQNGLVIASADNDVVIRNNTFNNLGFCGINIYNGFAGHLSINENSFASIQGPAIRVRSENGVTGDISHVSAGYNSFLNNTLAIQNPSTVPFPATCNWWGNISGPNAPGNPGSGDTVDGLVSYSPWLDAPNGNCDEIADKVFVVSPLAGDCLTPTNTDAIFSVRFNRLDATPMRGITTTIQLSSDLALFTGDKDVDIATGSLWADYSTTTQIIDNGGGSYTVDIAILSGPACGVATGGELFTVKVKAAAVHGVTGTLAVTAVGARDCANGQLPGVPGLSGSVAIDVAIPAAVTNLAATQIKTGNDTNGTTKIHLAWTASAANDVDWVKIYRKGFGSYPEYDDVAGTGVPADLPPNNGWTEVTTLAPTAVSYDDEPATRDFWYYRVIVTDACGNASLPSAQTGGTLNYHLGDVSDGYVIGNGNNLVFGEDISALGDHYGVADGSGDYLNYLDVGPTTNLSVNARPTTDNRIQFEDLMMFSLNFNVVSKENLPSVAPAAESAVVAKVGEVDPETGLLAVDIQMSGDGRIQGLSVPLTWNDGVVKPVGFTAGDLIAEQGGLGMVLSPAAGTIDAAIFGVRDRGICGVGRLATVTFQVLAAGDPGIAFGEITARDSENGPAVVSGVLAQPVVPTPVLTELYANTPNPFNPSTTLSFALSRQGNVQLKIYSVQGRLVATLVDGELPAGPHSVVWRGVDDAGHAVSSGAYIVRLEAPDATQSRRITLMK